MITFVNRSLATPQKKTGNFFHLPNTVSHHFKKSLFLRLFKPKFFYFFRIKPKCALLLYSYVVEISHCLVLFMTLMCHSDSCSDVTLWLKFQLSMTLDIGVFRYPTISVTDSYVKEECFQLFQMCTTGFELATFRSKSILITTAPPKRLKICIKFYIYQWQ